MPPSPHFGTEPQSLEEYVRGIYHAVARIEDEHRRYRDRQDAHMAKFEARFVEHEAAIGQSRQFQSMMRGIGIGVGAVVVPIVTAVLSGALVYVFFSGA